tara:strand:- start:372 stop:638 length:267 start_codon:yes stop_codon:yes gene_type:complete
MTRKLFIESLLALGGRKTKDSIDFLSNSLLIRDKKSRVEYTVKKIVKDENGKPVVICYRYYMPAGKDGDTKRVFIKIPSEDFKKYEPV